MNARVHYGVPYTIVIPTIGRPSLGGLMESLRLTDGPAPEEIVVVDDRAGDPAALALPAARAPVRVVRSGGQGPAAARNAGWRSSDPAVEWIAFLDDDVLVTESWGQHLQADLAATAELAAASQGRIQVPLPPGRPPTDWERNVAGLSDACWATADMAYRRDVLEEVGGFDVSFKRAFREDSDLGLRVTRAGYLILQGERTIVHPIRPAGWTTSVRLQAGNADDVLMRERHGPEWRVLAHAETGRSGRHVAVTCAIGAAAAAGLAARRRTALVALAGWAAGTAEFAWKRIAPGPRSAVEVTTMLATSAAIPPAACFHMGRAHLARIGRRVRSSGDRGVPSPGPALQFPSVRARWRFGPVPRPMATDIEWQPKAVLFDRDGTLIADRHYLGDPEQVALMPGARLALARIRQAGLATAVVTNQSGVARGLISRADVDRVNRRVDDLLGGFDAWAVCCHGPTDGCDCRKPRPGLVVEAAERLGVSPAECAVIGDIGADLEAARSAGARGVLVPTTTTLGSEIRGAQQVAPDLLTAVDLVLGGRC